MVYDLERLKKFYELYPSEYTRWATREVMVGSVGIGGKNPIRVQSMTTTDTLNTLATVEQSIRMIEAGCELIRITAPSKTEAENLLAIKNELNKRGYKAPLVADIHFTPNAAEIAARIVEKVRINPGNYADKKKFETIDYTDAAYQEEIERIRARFLPLVKICKEYGTAMRIGTNHGSLSDRILSRYGDTPQGMVESAMEFLRICRDENYHQIVLSMKASNTLVMVQAYRLLVATMRSEGMDYPLHLGVTEAGEAEDGRIKSAVGIGTLLLEGIGDTVRVSLTEEPEFEAPVAQKLIQQLPQQYKFSSLPSPLKIHYSPFENHRRDSHAILNIGAKHVPVVLHDISHKDLSKPSVLFPYGYQYSVPLDKWNISDQAADYVYTGTQLLPFDIPGTLGVLTDYLTWKQSSQTLARHYPLITLPEYLDGIIPESEMWVLKIEVEEAKNISAELPANALIWLYSKQSLPALALRSALGHFMDLGLHNPIIGEAIISGSDSETVMIQGSTVLGGLLVDGLIDGIHLGADEIAPILVNQISFGILQAARSRVSKTEYISCPSCGRTLFDLQETTAKIRAKTDHLKGIKIGIMGCIVNGPGEMADADYGYVGVGPGKINLYKEKTVVKKNVPSEQAVDELIKLIKDHGDWVEKPLLTE